MGKIKLFIYIYISMKALILLALVSATFAQLQVNNNADECIKKIQIAGHSAFQGLESGLNKQWLPALQNMIESISDAISATNQCKTLTYDDWNSFIAEHTTKGEQTCLGMAIMLKVDVENAIQIRTRDSFVRVVNDLDAINTSCGLMKY